MKKATMNLRLRKISIKDATGFLKAINSKEVIITLDNIKFPFTINDAKKYIKRSIEDNRKKESYEFVILYDNEIIGSVVLENPSLSKKSYEVGCFVSKNYWDRGIATWALKEIVKFGFYKLRIKRIWGGVLTTNKRSIKILEKAEFKREGHLRKATYKNGRFYDDYIYAKVR